MDRVVGALSGLVAGVVLASNVACRPLPAPGDREATRRCEDAGACTTTCPPGETCSDAVLGLSFEHRGRCPGALAPVAIDGTELLGVLGWRDGWRAESSDETVLDVVLEDDVLVLRGRSRGTAFLRVLDADGLLLDRLAIDARAVAGADLFAGWPSAWGTAPTRGALFVPDVEVPLWPGLVDRDGAYVVDDSARVFEPGPLHGCSGPVTVPAEGFRIGFDVAGGAVVAVAATTTRVDDFAVVECFGHSPSDDDGVRTYPSGGDLCIEARLEGRSVVGFLPAVRVDGAPAEVQPDLWFGRVTLPSLETTRDVIVEASAGDVSRAFALRVVVYGGSPLLADDVAPATAVPGERMRAALARP